MKVRVLLNDNPVRMIPIGCAVQGACRADRDVPAYCGSAHAGDAFIAFDLDVVDPPDCERHEPSCTSDTCDRIDNDAPVLTVLEDAFAVGNRDEDRGTRWPRWARSMSIGDVVIVGENAFACDASPGWTLLDADTVRSLVIREHVEPSA